MTEQVKDFYGILEIEKDASDKEIKKAHRRLAAKYHPDVSKEENAKELFQRIQEAYEILSDPESRKEYDESVEKMKEGKSVTFEEVFSDFETTTVGAHSPRKGQDVEIMVSFKVEDIRKQKKKSVEFDRYENCDDCEGHGFKRRAEHSCEKCQGFGFQYESKETPFGDVKHDITCKHCEGKGYTNTKDCETCKGTGSKTVKVKVPFTVPQETYDGYRFVIRNQGDAGFNGGTHGDLILLFSQDYEDPYKMVNGHDLETTIDVPFVTALAGGNVSVNLPKGNKIKVPVPRGAQSNHHIILPDEGLYNASNGFYGSLTVKLNILIPDRLADDKISKLVNILS